MREGQLRRRIVETGRAMYARGLIVAADGNVSARLDERHLLITPTGRRKGALTEDDLVVCRLEDGAPRAGELLRPSLEIRMHVLVYAKRPDVMAVVHAHPPLAIAHTVAGIPLDQPLMPEAFVALGHVPTIPYTTPTTEEVPRALAEPILRHDALLLARHGSLTLGKTVEEAYDRLEVLEHFAKISLAARALAPGGGVEGLSLEALAALRTILGMA